MVNDCAFLGKKDFRMSGRKQLLLVLAVCLALSACSSTKYLKGGLYRELDENLTIVGLTEAPNKYLNH